MGEWQGWHLVEHVCDSGLKEGGEETAEVKPDSCQTHSTVHAVLQHGGEASPLRHPWEVPLQGFQIKPYPQLRPAVKDAAVLALLLL